MARLNEAPLPVDSAEALRRRFTRQNYNLANKNSTQSARIRALEHDASRLAAENLSLRQEIIRLQTQLTTERCTNDRPRLELQAMIEETLKKVAAIGQIQKPEIKKKITDPSSWRPKMSRAQGRGQDGPWMPVISENRQDPRRTLDSDEIRALRLSDHSNESPDLGPPPVAHFDAEDPIKFDAQPESQWVEPEQDEDGIPATLSVNLETRRRRKDSISKFSSVLADTPNQVPTRTLRIGAKRKLGVWESEDTSNTTTKDHFRFSRKPTAVPILPGLETKPIETSTTMESMKSDLSGVAEGINVPGVERKVLGDKSVNMSPQKPRISARTGKASKEDPRRDFAKPVGPAAKVRTRKPRISNAFMSSEKEDIVVDSVEDPEEETASGQSAPRTPALELFSPTPSEPSVVRPEGRDTPPPGRFNARGMMDGLLDARPSRRARAAVNYAEPSLNTKMRRPTKELVSAVYPIEKREASSSLPPDDKVGMQPVIIKQETSDRSEWEDLPTALEATMLSPLRTKTGTATNEAPASNTVKSEVHNNKSETELHALKPSAPAAHRLSTGRATSGGQNHRRHTSVPHKPSDAVDKDVTGSDCTSLTSSSPVRDTESDEQLSVEIASVVEHASAPAAGRFQRAASRRRSMML